MPDRITAATYLCAAASAGGDVTLRDIRPEELATVTDALTQAGCAVERRADSLCLRAEGPAPGHPAHPDGAVPGLSHGRPGHPDGGAAAQPGRHRL